MKSRKKYRDNNNEICITVDIDKDIDKEIRLLAVKEKTTVKNIINTALAEYLEENK